PTVRSQGYRCPLGISELYQPGLSRRLHKFPFRPPVQEQETGIRHRRAPAAGGQKRCSFVHKWPAGCRQLLSTGGNTLRDRGLLLLQKANPDRLPLCRYLPPVSLILPNKLAAKYRPQTPRRDRRSVAAERPLLSGKTRCY